MAVRIVPIVPKYSFLNSQKIQVGYELLEQLPYRHDYKTANVGDPFKSYPSEFSPTGVWEDAVPFTATLEIIKSLDKGKVEVLDINLHRSYLFLASDFVHVTQNADISQGQFTGTFDFVKKGNAFGIKLVQ